MKAIVGVALGLFCAASSLALEWKESTVSVEPAKESKEVRAHYSFSNGGKVPVHFLGVTTSCGCTEAYYRSDTVKPGETGTLDVLFTVGPRFGLQEKKILVRTDDTTELKELILRVKLPDRPAAAAPRLDQ